MTGDQVSSGANSANVNLQSKEPGQFNPLGKEGHLPWLGSTYEQALDIGGHKPDLAIYSFHAILNGQVSWLWNMMPILMGQGKGGLGISYLIRNDEEVTFLLVLKPLKVGKNLLPIRLGVVSPCRKSPIIPKIFPKRFSFQGKR